MARCETCNRKLKEFQIKVETTKKDGLNGKVFCCYLCLFAFLKTRLSFIDG